MVSGENAAAYLRLAALYPEFKGQAIDVELNGSVERDQPQAQLALVLGETPPPYRVARTQTRKSKEHLW